jgi:sialate O-acetylesterase
MIAPLAPFAIKGALWYQGESNLIDYGDGAIYADKMGALVQGWRALFNQDMAFYYVQIAPHLYHVVRPAQTVSPEAEPLLWEAQTASLRIPHTGMVVTTDLVDDLADIHPRNKKEVGERLARLALSKDYGRSGIVASGPMLRAMEVAGARAILSFDHVGAGLVSADGKPLNWFTIAGADGKFHPAIATIEQDRVIVSSAWVNAPKVVRFAWDEAARPNFKNKDGLPAVPFRTDNPFTRPGPGKP